MSKWYMITLPRNRVCKRMLKIMIEENDIHEWIIAREVGAKGYEHWQIRVKVGNNDFYDLQKIKSGGTTVVEKIGWFPRHFPFGHIEESSDNIQYERKGGDYWTSYDTVAQRCVRFGQLRPSQKDILRILRSQDDRTVDVFYDGLGSHGKSFLSIHLWEQGKALLVPRYATTPRGVSQFICSAWKGEPFIIIDIPRSAKIEKTLYDTIEEIKDGMVFDERYSGRCRSVRGTKLAVFTNQKLDLKALSQDRWRIHGITGEPQIHPRGKKKKSPETPSPKGEGAESFS